MLVPGDQRVDDFKMLGHERIGVRHIDRDAEDVLAQRQDAACFRKRRQDFLVGARIEAPNVKIELEIIHSARSNVGIFGEGLGMTPPHLIEEAAAQVRHRVAQRDRFQQFAELIEMGDLALVQRHDRPALTRILLQHAEALDPGQHVVGNSPAHAVMTSHLVFVHAETAEGGSIDDGAFDALVDGLPGERFLDRRQTGIGSADHLGFEGGAKHLDALWTDNVATPVETADETGLSKLRQCLAHGSAARSEELGQAAFEQQRAALQLFAFDRARQDAGELRVERLGEVGLAPMPSPVGQVPLLEGVSDHRFRAA